MQFHKIELHPRPEPSAIIISNRPSDQKLCRTCGVQPAGAYVGCGVYVSDTCSKCYRAAGIERKEREGYCRWDNGGKSHRRAKS